MRSLLPLVSALSIATALPSTRDESDPLPLVIWHGLGDNFAADGMKSVGELAEEINPGTYIYNIRLADTADGDRQASFFGNVTSQIEDVCAALAAEPILSTAPAINALGFSQGGQFLRGYVQRCNNPPVRNLVTFGSQHNGIVEFQACRPNDWLCKGAMGLLKWNTWGTFVQSRLVPAQYYRTTNPVTAEPTDEYLENSNWLADINNERLLKNVTYAERLATLNKLVMYVFKDDKVAIPKESGWFAEVNGTDGTVIPLRNRTIYKEDWIGLKKLDKKNGLIFKTIPGDHMQLDEEVLRETFKTYFSPPSEEKNVDVQIPLVSWEL